MCGSGMLILNCPYQVDTAITDAMLEGQNYLTRRQNKTRFKHVA